MSYSKLFSPAQVESDQKDLIISQLKADIYEHKRNQQDYFELSQQLRNFQNRYELLNDEKEQSEEEFRIRNEKNFKLVSNLKSEYESLTQTIKSKNIEFQELKADNIDLQDLNQERKQHLQKIDEELKDLEDCTVNLQHERENLKASCDRLNLQKKQLLLSVDSVQKNKENQIKHNFQLEHLTQQGDFQNKQIQQQINSTQTQKSSEESELKNKKETLDCFQDQISQGKSQFVSLQQDLLELEKIRERSQDEFSELDQQVHSLLQQNQAIQDQIELLEQDLKRKEQEIQEINNNCSNSKKENTDYIQINQKFSFDLEALKTNLETILDKNQELMEELEKYCQQDQEIWQILNRNSRIRDIRTKTEKEIKKSLNRIPELLVQFQIKNFQ